MLDPHGMDPQTVLRFVRAVGGWPGKVVVIACEPAEVEEMGLGLTPRSRRVDRAVDLVETVASCVRRATRLRRDVHELSLAGAVIDTVERHAAGRRVTAVYLRVGPPAPGRARLAGVLLRARRARHGVRGRAPGAGARPGAPALRAAAHEWELDGIDFRCPACGAADAKVVSGEEFRVESIDVEEQEAACTA